jgi:hypothetical protein
MIDYKHQILLFFFQVLFFDYGLEWNTCLDLVNVNYITKKGEKNGGLKLIWLKKIGEKMTVSIEKELWKRRMFQMEKME